MKIERKETKTIKFGQLKNGAVFLTYDNDVCMKILSSEENVVFLGDGSTIHYCDEELVIPVEAKVVLEVPPLFLFM